jgi:hypothetical protein
VRKGLAATNAPLITGLADSLESFPASNIKEDRDPDLGARKSFGTAERHHQPFWSRGP